MTTVSPGPSPSSVGSQATSSLEPIVGSTAAGSTVTPNRRGQRAGHRLPQLGRTVRGRVAGVVGGGAAERRAHDVGHRVDGGADREVDDPPGVRLGQRAVRGQRVPGEVGKGDRSHSSCCCGGRLLAGSTSKSDLPTFEAPPGEPSSSKKSTLALV